MAKHDNQEFGSFDFLARRRRVMSDRTWFGMGLIAVGLGVANAERGWAWALLLVALVGTALVALGVRRAFRRPREPGQDWPRPPW